MLPIETTYLKPRSSILIIPGLIAIGIFLVVGTQKNLDPNFQYFLLIPIAIIVLLWLGSRKVQITIDNEGFTHKTIFYTRQFLWKEVVKTYIKYEHHGKSGSHYWFFELPDRKVKFSTSSYSRKSLKTIAEAVVEKCNHAEIEDRIFKMAEGHFPWYIF